MVGAPARTILDASVKSPPDVREPMAATRTATAVWENDLMHGQGTVQGASGALPSMGVSWSARTEASGGKTSPEELLAAAHASCFSMAVTSELVKVGITDPAIVTTATVELKQVNGEFTITSSHLDVMVEAKGADKSKLAAAAEAAKANCPVSKLLRAEVTMTATYST